MLYSFVTEKSSKTKLELLKREDPSSASAIKLKILKGSLTANNKFYLDFGEKPPFSFFNTFPVSKGATLVEKEDSKDVHEKYVHPPVWGLCEVVESSLSDVPVGTVYRAMLPMGTQVAFEQAHVDPKLGDLVIHRPTTHAAYNHFSLIPAESVCHPSSLMSGLALTCYGGIITGFGLYFALKQADYYGGCDTIVCTSASSKVSLAFALYMKDTAGKKLIGYTSKSNKEFCKSTGLYSEVLSYDDPLPESLGNNIIMVDVSGKGGVYKNQQARVKKLLVVGNSSGTPDQESTPASFTTYATIKMMLSLMGGPKWIRSRMNPQQEIFLIMDVLPVLYEEWGKDKYLATMEEYTAKFCQEASSKWMKERLCDTEDSIQTAFGDIIEGSVPPSEYVVLDVAKALEGRK